MVPAHLEPSFLQSLVDVRFYKWEVLISKREEHIILAVSCKGVI